MSNYWIDETLLDKEKTIAICAGAGVLPHFEDNIKPLCKEVLRIDVKGKHLDYGRALVRNGGPEMIEMGIDGAYYSTIRKEGLFKEFPTITIEQLEKNHGEIHILKIDIEGEEFAIFDSLDDVNFEQIIFEIHDFLVDSEENVEDAQRLLNKIQDWGYDCVWYNESDKIKMLRDKKNETNPLRGIHEFVFVRRDLNKNEVFFKDGF